MGREQMIEADIVIELSYYLTEYTYENEINRNELMSIREVGVYTQSLGIFYLDLSGFNIVLEVNLTSQNHVVCAERVGNHSSCLERVIKSLKLFLQSERCLSPITVDLPLKSFVIMPRPVYLNSTF